MYTHITFKDRQTKRKKKKKQHNNRVNEIYLWLSKCGAVVNLGAMQIFIYVFGIKKTISMLHIFTIGIPVLLILFCCRLQISTRTHTQTHHPCFVLLCSNFSISSSNEHRAHTNLPREKKSTNSNNRMKEQHPLLSLCCGAL